MPLTEPKDQDAEWYVIVRRDNGYPVNVYATEKQAHMMADVNGLDVVAVQPVREKCP